MIYIQDYDEHIDCRTLNHSDNVFRDALWWIGHNETYFHVEKEGAIKYDLVYFSNDEIIKSCKNFPNNSLFENEIVYFDYFNYDINDKKHIYLDIFNAFDSIYFESANEFTITIIRVLQKYTDLNIYVSDKRFFWFFDNESKINIVDSYEKIKSTKIMHVEEDFVHSPWVGVYDNICSITLFHNMFLLQYLNNLSRFKIKNIILSIPDTEGIGSILNHYYRIENVCSAFGIDVFLKSNCTRYSDEILEKCFKVKIAKNSSFKKVVFQNNKHLIKKMDDIKKFNDSLHEKRSIRLKNIKSFNNRLHDGLSNDLENLRTINKKAENKLADKLKSNMLCHSIFNMSLDDTKLNKNRLKNFNKKIQDSIEINVEQVKGNDFIKDIAGRVKDNKNNLSNNVTLLKEKLYQDINGVFSLDFFFALILTHIVFSENPPIDTSKLSSKFLNDIRQYKNAVFQDKKVLGVLVRGTDYITSNIGESPLPADELIKEIKEVKEKGNYDLIFLATEDKDYFNILSEAFPDELISVSQKRFSKSEFKNVTLLSELEAANNKEPGRNFESEDTMVNYFYAIYLLANCQGFLATPFCSGVLMVQSFNNKKFEFMKVVSSNKQKDN